MPPHEAHHLGDVAVDGHDLRAEAMRRSAELRGYIATIRRPAPEPRKLTLR